MRVRGLAGGVVNDFLQQLESRRLLSLTPFAAETPVPALGAAERSDVAVAADGSYLVVGLGGGGSAGPRTISAVRFSAEGEQLGAPLTVQSFASGGTSSWISASMDADGDAVVAFNVWGETQSEIYFSRISRAGQVSAPVLVDSELVNDLTHADVSFPAVSMAADGSFFLGWIHHITRDRHAVEMRVFEADGQPRGAEFVAREDSSPFSNISQLEVAARPDGSGAAFAYFFFGEDSFAQYVFTGRVSTTAPIGEAVLIGDTTDNPSVAIFPDGSSIVAYEDHPSFTDVSTASTESFVQRYDAAGVAQGAPIQLGAALGGTGIHSPDVDNMPDGGFVATFVRSVRNEGASTATNTLYASRYSAAGALDSSGAVPLDAKIAGISVTQEPQFQALDAFVTPAIGADADGRTVVAYVEDSTARYQRLAVDADASTPFGVLEGSVLRVDGTVLGDFIGIAADGDDIVVTRGSRTQTFAAAQVTAIVVNGSGGNDTIINDTAVASTILGGTGRDKILGGSGADSLSGGDGKDKLFGRDGKDSLSGNAGNDTLEGGLQADRVAGNGGRDRLYGNGGNDRLYGGAHGDWLYGQRGGDQLFGEGGNDRLYADEPSDGPHVDTLHGNAGDDLFVTADALVDSLFGDSGHDAVAAYDDDDVLDGIDQIL